MKRHAVRMLRIVTGTVLLTVGVIGGFIPVLQGWIFILLGLSIIAPESARARQLLDWAKTRVRSGKAGPSAPSDAGSGSIRSAGEGRNR